MRKTHSSFLTLSLGAFLTVFCLFAVAEAKGKKGSSSSSATETATGEVSTNKAASSEAVTTSSNAPAEKTKKKKTEEKASSGESKGKTERVTGTVESVDVKARKITVGGKTYEVAKTCKIYTLENDGDAYLSSIEKGAQVILICATEDGAPTVRTLSTKEAAAGKELGLDNPGERPAASGKSGGKKKK